MSHLWPWLAVAGLGALHGLNPATGWMFAVAWGVRSHDRRQAMRALVPIAFGHAASVVLMAAAVALGFTMDRVMLEVLAGVLLVAAMVLHLSQHKGSHAGLALWSFVMSTVHGTGLMLVPAFVPLCMANTPAREIAASGSLMLALAAVGVHMAAMLIVIGVIASVACRGVALGSRRLCGDIRHS